MGGVKVVGGLVEGTIGVGLLLAPEPTFLTKVAGVAVTAHGADVTVAGLREVWTGEKKQTFTEQGISWGAQQGGASPEGADRAAAMLDTAISILGTLGAGYLYKTAPEAGAQLIHLTSRNGKIGIEATDTLRGTQGVFALPETAACQGTAMRFLRTGIPLSRTEAIVRIPQSANPVFRQPRPVGLFSLWQRLSGAYRAPAGVLQPSTGIYGYTSMTYGEWVGSLIIPYVGDSAFWMMVAAARLDNTSPNK